MRRLLFAVLAATVGAAALAQTDAPTNPGARQPFGYSSVLEALEALKAKPGVQVQITKPDAWTIINEPGNIQWSFTPSGHYAYPAVVKREIKVNAGGDVYIEMSGLCQAEKAPCDRLMDEFRDLNERTRQTIRSRLERK